MSGPSRSNDDFDRCWPWLNDALEFEGFSSRAGVWKTHTKEQLRARVATGSLYLWPGQNSAVATLIFSSPTGLRSHHTWLAGGNLEEIVNMTALIEKWGAARGCHRQVAFGRRGWLRALDGYREIGTYRDKSLIG